jgi:hypothetical protein
VPEKPDGAGLAPCFLVALGAPEVLAGGEAKFLAYGPLSLVRKRCKLGRELGMGRGADDAVIRPGREGPARRLM